MLATKSTLCSPEFTNQFFTLNYSVSVRFILSKALASGQMFVLVCHLIEDHKFVFKVRQRNQNFVIFWETNDVNHLDANLQKKM